MSFKKTKLAVAVAAGLALSPAAFATNGIMQVGNGMVAHGMGGAGLSNATEAMSGFDNPALISDTGDSVSMAFSVFMPNRSIDLAGNEYKSDANMFAIPQAAFSSKISSDLSWGISMNAMGGMNTTYQLAPVPFGPYWYMPQGADLSGMIIAPTLSYAPSKSMSFGGSLLIGYENLRLTNAFGLGNYASMGMIGAAATNEGSTLAYGVKLGADFKIGSDASVGVVLQPKMSAGEFSFFKNLLSAFGFTGDSSLVLPNIFGVGGKYTIGKNVDIAMDIMDYQWSSVDVFDFFGWQDQIVYKLGVEWRATDKLALRAGVNYGKSPIQGDTIAPAGGGMPAVIANYLFPAVTEQHVTIGLGYKMDKNMALNAYYLYAPKTTVQDTYSPYALSMTQNAFGLGFNYSAK